MKPWRLPALLIFIALLVWFGGPYIAIAGKNILMGANERLLILLLLALFWGVKNFQSGLTKNKTMGPITSSLPVLLPNSDLILFQQNFETVINNLKSSSFLGVKSWNRSSHLPFFLVLGPDKSGKSSLLAQQNLGISKPFAEFKYSEWWKTSKAIFFAFSESSSFENDKKNALWLALIDLLRNHQKIIPLQGIILTLPLAQLSLQSHAQQETKIQKLAQALHLLAQHHKNLAVHLVFTHCDLIAGFAEYFDDLDAEERANPIGITFDIHKNSINYREDFSTQFDQLLQKLTQRLIIRLHREPLLKKRHALKDFPAQLETLRSLIGNVIDLLVNASGLKVKGCYLTSNMQNGNAIDYLGKQISNTFDWQPYLHKKTSLFTQSKTFFIEKLLTNIIPESNKSIKIIEQKQLLNYIIYSSCVIVFSVSTFLWYKNYKDNIGIIHAITATLAQQKTVSQNEQYPELFALNSLSHSSAALSALHQAGQLAKATQNTYQEILIKQFLPHLKKIVENQLTAATAQNPGILYEALKVYLMLGSTEHRNPDYIKTWFARYWQNTLGSDPKTAIVLNQHLDALLAIPNTSVSLEPSLIAQARNVLQAIPLEKLSYSELRAHYPRQIKLFDNSRSALIIKDNYSISTIFTAQNFNAVYNQEILKIAHEILNNYWVLDTQQNSGDLTPETLASVLQNDYLNDYAQAWNNLLGHIVVKDYQNLNEASNVSENLSRPNGSLFQLLQTIQINTAPNPAIPEFTHLVSNPFTSLNTYSQNSANQLQIILAAFSSYLKTMTMADNPDQAIFQAVTSRMINNGQGDAIEDLLQKSEALPAPLQLWMNNLGTNSWHMMVNAAQNYLNDTYSKLVLSDYNNSINNRYPVFKNSSDDISLDQFSKFFAPNGTLDSFFNNYMKPFIDSSHYYWTWKTVDGIHIDIPQQTLDMFIRASVIQKMYFSDGTAARPLVKFSLSPVALEPSVTTFSLNLNGQMVNLQQGQPSSPSSLFWPGPQPDMTSIQFIDSQGNPASLTKQGDWSWFRLLDNANMQKTANTKVYKIVFDLNGNSVKYDLFANDAVNAFIPGIIEGFRCPDRL